MKKTLVACICASILVVQILTGCLANPNSGISEKVDTTETDVSKFEYEDINGGVQITKYIGDDKKVVVPSIIDNKMVTKIVSSVFSGNVMLEEITLPEYLDSDISFEMFENCNNLKSITFLGTVDRFAGNDMLYSDIHGYIYNGVKLPKLEYLAFNSLNVKCFKGIFARFSNLKKISIKEFTELESFKFELSDPIKLNNSVEVEIPQNFINYIPTILQDDFVKITVFEEYEDEPSAYYAIKEKLTDVKEIIPHKAFRTFVVNAIKHRGELEPEFAVYRGINSNDVEVQWIEGTMIINGKQMKIKFFIAENIDCTKVTFQEGDYADGENWNKVYENTQARIYSYEDITSYDAKVCIVFGCRDITINGIHYTYEF